METIKNMMTDKVNAENDQVITAAEALGYTMDFLQELPYISSLDELTEAVGFYLIHSTDNAERKKATARKLATLTDLMILANRNSREISMVANSWTSEELERLKFQIK